MGTTIERDAPSVVIRVRLFGEFEVERRSTTGAWESVSDWGKGLNAKQTLKYLLNRGRMARRQDVVDALWEQSEPALAEDYLIKAVTKLRQALHSDRHSNLLQTVYNRTTYTLADQSRIWVDADACEEAIRDAEQIGITSTEGVRLLEQAAGWFEQGPFLAGEGGLWSHGWRGRIETAQYRCLLALIDGYIYHQQWRKAETRAEQLLRDNPLDEQALARLMHLLHTQGLTTQMQQRYRDAKAFYQKQQVPFPSMLDTLVKTFQDQLSLDNGWVRLSPASEDVLSILAPNALIPIKLQTLPISSSSFTGKKFNSHPLSNYSSFHGYLIAQEIVELIPYERNIRAALHIHRTSNAQRLLQDIDCDIHNLEYLEDQAEGDFLIRIKILLLANGLLATKIVKDETNYALAYAYANNAVRIAKSLCNDVLISTTKYTRVCVKLEWGVFGTMKQGRFHPDNKKVQDALRDFQSILLTSRQRSDLLHPQLQGSTHLQLSRAHALLQSGSSDSKEPDTLTLIEQAAEMVGCDPIDDFSLRLLLAGTLSGLHTGGYFLVKAGILNVVGLPNKAMIELNQLKRLREQTYGQDETRNLAWNTITMAEALLGLGEYEEAAIKAKEALITCHHIHSLQNTMMIADISSRLAMSAYGKSNEVKELGDMINEWYGTEKSESRYN